MKHGWLQFVILGLIGLSTLCVPAVGFAEASLTIAAVSVSGNVLEQPIVDQFEKDHGVEVNVISFPGSDYTDKVMAMIAAGNAPDVITNWTWTNGAYIQQGMLLSLSPFLKQDPQFAGGFFPAGLQEFTYNGQVYGISRGNQAQVLFYNLDAFKDNGLSTPTGDWRWSHEFATAARKLTRDTNGDGQTDVWGLSGAGNWYWLPIWSYGASLLNRDETQFTLNQPAGVDALNLVSSLFQQGFANLSGIGGTWGAIENGKADMAFADAVGASRLAALTSSKKGAVSWDVSEPPQGPAGHATTLQSAAYSIPKTTKDPVLAWQLIRALTDDHGITVLTKQYAVGQVLPSRRSVMLGVFMTEPPPPANRAAFLHALTYAQAFQVAGPKWPKISDALNPALTQILTGKAAPRQALDGLAPQINGILQD